MLTIIVELSRNISEGAARLEAIVIGGERLEYTDRQAALRALTICLLVFRLRGTPQISELGPEGQVLLNGLRHRGADDRHARWKNRLRHSVDGQGRSLYTQLICEEPHYTFNIQRTCVSASINRYPLHNDWEYRCLLDELRGHTALHSADEVVRARIALAESCYRHGDVQRTREELQRLKSEALDLAGVSLHLRISALTVCGKLLANVGRDMADPRDASDARDTLIGALHLARDVCRPTPDNYEHGVYELIHDRQNPVLGALVVIAVVRALLQLGICSYRLGDLESAAAQFAEAAADDALLRKWRPDLLHSILHQQANVFIERIKAVILTRASDARASAASIQAETGEWFSQFESAATFFETIADPQRRGFEFRRAAELAAYLALLHQLTGEACWRAQGGAAQASFSQALRCFRDAGDRSNLRRTVQMIQQVVEFSESLANIVPLSLSVDGEYLSLVEAHCKSERQ